MQTVIRHLKEKTNPLLHAGMNLLFPPRCLSCSKMVDSPYQFCPDCFSQLQFIAEPHCDHCGLPFEYDLGDDAICGMCMQEPPLYTQAHAAFHYNEFSRSMVTRFKYSDHTNRLPGYAQLLARAGTSIIAKSDAIVPVPLHPKRMLQRKYNQAALLSHGLSDICSLPVWPDALLRIKDTPPQASLSRNERLTNVKGAFRTNHAYASQLSGASILLVDDVMTTGATLSACTKMLLGASAKAVYVLTLARTVRD